MNQKKNKHFLKADKKIQEKLLEIVNEDKKPTVAKICQRAQINRTTFYLHYVDIVELMEKIQNEIFQSFTNSYQQNGIKLTLMSHLSYEMFAKHVKQNKNFYKYYFKINTTFPLKDGYDYIWQHVIIPYFHEKEIYNEDIMKLRFICFQSGFTMTLKSWVEHDCQLSCQEVATILSTCICL